MLLGFIHTHCNRFAYIIIMHLQRFPMLPPNFGHWAHVRSRTLCASTGTCKQAVHNQGDDAIVVPLGLLCDRLPGLQWGSNRQ